MPESFVKKARKIQRQHIEEALNYIANCPSTPNSVGIRYILDTHKPANRAIWYEHTDKWFGVKETIRVAYLFAIGKTSPFSDDDVVNELGPPSPRVDSDYCERWTTNQAQKILEEHGFLCKEMGSESSEEEDE